MQQILEKMINTKDPDQPSAYFWTDHNDNYGLVVCTRTRFMNLTSGKLAKFIILWCKLFHSNENKTSGMPTIGKNIWYPITCHKCGSKYEIERKRTIKHENYL